MKLNQLTQAPDISELASQVDDLRRRYSELFGTQAEPLSEQGVPDVVQELKSELLASEDTTYQGIDFLMRELSHAHDVNVQDMHDAFVHAEGVTPDEWIQSHKSAT